VAINRAGVVAGQSRDGAFTWADGRVTRYAPKKFFYLDGRYTSVATAINLPGVAVGSDGSYEPLVMSGLELATAVLFQNGKMTFLDSSKEGTGTFEADGINDSGVIVGEDQYRGFVRYPDGREIIVRPLSTRTEWNGTRASAIDNEGNVVGATTIDVPWRLDVYAQRGPHSIGGLPIHAFWLRIESGKQHMTDLGSIRGFLDTYATAIAEDQTIVGYSGTKSGPKWSLVRGVSHAWVWQHGTMSDLGMLLHGDSSWAYGANDRGEVVGCSGASDEHWLGMPYTDRPTRAVIWRNKRIADLNDLIPAGSGWRLLCAYAINRDGWIVGDGNYKGSHQAFLLKPLR